MSDLQRFEDLLSRHLDATLDDGEQRELAELALVPGNASVLLEILRMDREISGLLSVPVKSEAMARSVLEDIRRADVAGSSGRRLFDKSIAPQIKRRRVQRDRSWMTTAALAAAACVAIFFFWRQETRQSPRPIGSVAAADATSAGAVRGRSGEKLAVGMTLFVGDRIEAFGDAENAHPKTAAALTLFDGAAVRMGEGAIVVIESGSDQPVLGLESGRIFIETSSLSQSGRHLRVRSPCGDVLSLGTRFEVFAGKEATTVSVEEGRVVFSNALGEQRLRELQTSRALAGAAPSEPTAVAAGDIWRGVDTGTPDGPRDGLIAYWHLDEANGLVAHDAALGHHAATLHNGAAWKQGLIGGALSFDGIDDFAEFPPMRLGDKFTISAWIWSEHFPGPQSIIGNDQHSTVLGYDDWTVANGCIRFGSSGGTWVSWEARPPLEEWHHVVVTCDQAAGTAELTLDGRGHGAKTFHGDFVTANNHPRFLGRSYRANPSDACFFRGMIDDARIYDRVLSKREILALYHMGDRARDQR